MKKRGFPKHLIKASQSLYRDTRIVIDTGKQITQEIVINQGVRQGCSLSPTLFNLYIDDVLRIWKENNVAPGIELGPSQYLNTMLFADDQVIIQDKEDKLQMAVHRLHQLSKLYNLRISKTKTKTMAFLGSNPIRTKIVIEDQVLEQVSHFQYLGCDITYDEDKDIKNKVNTFQRICGTIRRTLKNKTRKETQIKFYKVMAVPTVLYGSECWVPKKNELRQIESSEMKFLRSVKGCTRLDKLRNTQIRDELGVQAVTDKLQEYKHRWKEHILRMPNERIPKQAMEYQPIGKRSVGRPRKRW